MGRRKIVTTKRLASIPHIQLQLDAICKRAENNGIYTIESDARGTVYMCSNEELMIVTANRGYIRMTEVQAALIAAELPDILDGLKFRREARVG